MDTIQFIDIFYHYSNINTKIITSIVYCILSKHWYPYRLFHNKVTLDVYMSIISGMGWE